MGYERILAASNLEAGADQVVITASQLAAATGARLTVLHALSPSRLESLREDLPAQAAYVDVLIDRFRADLDEQVERVAAGIGAEPMVTTGDPAAQVLAVATAKGADLVVIGIRSRSRVGKLLMGSTAQEILLASECPVVGVPI